VVLEDAVAGRVTSLFLLFFVESSI